MSESDVQVQSIFIEAIRNKLIDRHDLSVTQFKEIIEKQPDNHVAWYELAFALDKTKKYDEALDAITKALSYLPNSTHYLQLEATVYHDLQKAPDELNTYKKLQSLEPYKESHYTAMVDLLVHSSNLIEAVKVLTLLEDQKGINEISSLQKASLYQQLGKNKDAESELVKLYDAFPTETKYMHALASFYVKQNKVNKANEIFKQIIAISPADERANLALASTYRLEGKDDEYLVSIQTLMENQSIPMDTKVLELIPYLQKGIDSKDQGLLSLIEKYAALLVQDYPKEAKPYALYGDVLIAFGKKGLAYQQYQKAVALNNSVKPLWANYIELAELFEDGPENELIAEQAYDLFPNDITMAMAYTKALIKSGKINEAKSALLQTQMMASNRKEYLESTKSLELALAFAEGNSQQVDQLKSSIKSINPKSFLAYYIPATLLVSNQKNDAKVMDLINQGLKEFPTSADLRGYKAILLFRAKKYEEAKALFESALPLPSGQTHLYHEYYGDTLFMLKDVDQAMIEWNKSLELNPNNSKLKKKILDKTIK